MHQVMSVLAEADLESEAPVARPGRQFRSRLECRFCGSRGCKVRSTCAVVFLGHQRILEGPVSQSDSD
uniref:Uncharacterized protein n=1 Tax=Sphaerodactylus townsendi TaxID=933632 RepID=A0ACB8EC54_9SAUR